MEATVKRPISGQRLSSILLLICVSLWLPTKYRTSPAQRSAQQITKTNKTRAKWVQLFVQVQMRTSSPFPRTAGETFTTLNWGKNCEIIRAAWLRPNSGGVLLLYMLVIPAAGRKYGSYMQRTKSSEQHCKTACKTNTLLWKNRHWQRAWRLWCKSEARKLNQYYAVRPVCKNNRVLCKTFRFRFCIC